MRDRLGRGEFEQHGGALARRLGQRASQQRRGGVGGSASERGRSRGSQGVDDGGIAGGGCVQQMTGRVFGSGAVGEQ